MSNCFACSATSASRYSAGENGRFSAAICSAVGIGTMEYAAISADWMTAGSAGDWLDMVNNFRGEDHLPPYGATKVHQWSLRSSFRSVQDGAIGFVCSRSAD